jgi:hypothetical protein
MVVKSESMKALRIRLEFEDKASKGIAEFQKKISQKQKMLTQLAPALTKEQIGARARRLSLDRSNLATQQATLGVQKAQTKLDGTRLNNAHRFKMEYLGIMFGMMMINKGIMKFLHSSIETYKKATNNQGKFLKQTMKLNAAWTFLKFRLIDTLGRSDLFVNMIDFIVNIVDSIASLDDEQLEKISNSLVIMAGLTGLATVAASMKLLSSSISAMTSEAGGLGGIASSLSKIAGLGLIAWGISLMMDEEDIGKQVEGFGTALMGTGLFMGLKTVAGKRVFQVGAVLDFVGAAAAETATFSEILKSALGSGAAAGLTFGPVAGVAVGIASALMLSAIHPEAEFWGNLTKLGLKIATGLVTGLGVGIHAAFGVATIMIHKLFVSGKAGMLEMLGMEAKAVEVRQEGYKKGLALQKQLNANMQEVRENGKAMVEDIENADFSNLLQLYKELGTGVATGELIGQAPGLARPAPMSPGQTLGEDFQLSAMKTELNTLKSTMEDINQFQFTPITPEMLTSSSLLNTDMGNIATQTNTANDKMDAWNTTMLATPGKITAIDDVLYKKSLGPNLDLLTIQLLDTNLEFKNLNSHLQLTPGLISTMDSSLVLLNITTIDITISTESAAAAHRAAALAIGSETDAVRDLISALNELASARRDARRRSKLETAAPQ